LIIEKIEIEHFDPQVDFIEEGNEPEDFLMLFSDVSTKTLTRFEIRYNVRFFDCSSVSGAFETMRVFNFTQDDLMQDHVIILDAIEDCFVWAGLKSKLTDQKKAMEITMEYIKNTPSDVPRQSTCKAYFIKALQEPLKFRCYFHAWETHKDAKEEEVTLVEEILKEWNRAYTYQELIQKPLPKSMHMLDPTKLEAYLSDSEFEAIFKITREKFAEVPQWKQNDIKKSLGLF
jgi:advillin